MKTMEAEELGANINEVLREVESGQIVEVMRHGQIVARVVPVQPQKHDKEAILKALADLDKLAAEISIHWPAGISAEDAVNDVRGNS